MPILQGSQIPIEQQTNSSFDSQARLRAPIIASRTLEGSSIMKEMLKLNRVKAITKTREGDLSDDI